MLTYGTADEMDVVNWLQLFGSVTWGYLQKWRSRATLLVYAISISHKPTTLKKATVCALRGKLVLCGSSQYCPEGSPARVRRAVITTTRML